MKNRKGFTLIELLVTITIIGIIMIMILPAITNLQRENQKKKFDDYERVVLEAAKAYEDQYEEDLFGRYSEGCAYIDFKNLVDKKLLSTTKISGYECNYDTNGIIIRKVKGKSFYEVYLDCVKGNETKKLTDNSGYNSISRDYCDIGEDKTPPSLEIKCDSDTINGVPGDDFNETGIYYYSSTNKGNKNIPELTVKASDSNSGLEKNQYVTYEWKIYNDKAETKQIFTEKNKTIFNTKDGAGSTSKKNVRIIEAFKENNTTGKAIIALYGENIVDRAGNKLEEERKTCTYFYDNKPPEMTITLTGASGRNYDINGTGWINEEVTTTVTVTDVTENGIYSGINPNSLTRNNGEENLSGGVNTYTFTRTDANRNEIDTYKVCDKVGNCTSKTVNIKVDTIYPTCKSRGGDTNWRTTNLTIYGDCVDQGDPSQYSDCRKNQYDNTYSNNISITNATAGQACDNAGNCVTCSEDQEVHIDKTPPKCTHEAPQNENNPGLDVRSFGTCSEPDGEIEIVRWNGSVSTVIPKGKIVTIKKNVEGVLSGAGKRTFVCYNRSGLSCTFSVNVVESTCKIYKTYSTGNKCMTGDCVCASCSKGNVKVKKQWWSTNNCHMEWDCAGYEKVTSGKECGYHEE